MILALHHSVKHFTCSCNPLKDFPGGSVVKYLPANIGDIGSIPGLGRSPGGGMATPYSIPTWRIPWTEEPSRLQSMGSESQTQLSRQAHSPPNNLKR